MIQVALIGLGYWGPNIFRVLNAEQNVNIKYICDINSDALAKYQDNHICINNYEDILKDTEIQLVFIVTPISSHFKIIMDCLNAKKHVFVEKPLCKTRIEMNTIYNVCEQHKLKIFCDYIFCYSSKIQKLKQIIHSDIGNILYIEMYRETFGKFSKDNIIYDLLPHDISILKYLFEDKITISHVDKIYNKSLFIKSIIHFNINNMNGFINISWLNENKTRKIKFFCNNKIIEYDDTNDNIRIFNYYLNVNQFEIEQQKNISEEIVNTHREEPLQTSIKCALYMIENNDSEIFIQNKNISECIIDCFEKIL